MARRRNFLLLVRLGVSRAFAIWTMSCRRFVDERARSNAHRRDAQNFERALASASGGGGCGCVLRLAAVGKRLKRVDDCRELGVKR